MTLFVGIAASAPSIPSAAGNIAGSGASSSTLSLSHPLNVTTAKRGSKSGFFANLHPSRWSRGAGSANSGYSNPNSASAGSSSQSRVDRSHGSSVPARTGTNLVQNTNAFLAMSYKEQVKAWLKEQTAIFANRYCHLQCEGPGTGSHDGANILPKLSEVIEHIKRVS